MVVQFDPDVWEEEVHRFEEHSRMRQTAERARRSLETERLSVGWLPCEAEGPAGPRLPRCVKLYLPLDREPSAVPCRLVSELVASREPGPVFPLRLLAFGERHPRPGTRSVP